MDQCAIFSGPFLFNYLNEPSLYATVAYNDYMLDVARDLSQGKLEKMIFHLC